MKISDETGRKLYNAGEALGTDETARKLYNAGEAVGTFVSENSAPLIKWSSIGLAAWFGCAAVVGLFASVEQDNKHTEQDRKLIDMAYFQTIAPSQCTAVDPNREVVITVTGQQNSRFTQILRAAAPIISMTDGEDVTVGTAPVYTSVPCNVIKDGIERYDNIHAARGAEYPNAQRLRDHLRELRTQFHRTENLTFTIRDKSETPNTPSVPSQP